MKLRFASLVFATTLCATSAFAAGPTLMIGLSFDFGANPKENIGLTAKVISTDQRYRFIGAAGGTYFPFAKEQFGLDVSGGYLADHVAATAGYDFLRWTPQVSVGWAPSR